MLCKISFLSVYNDVIVRLKLETEKGKALPHGQEVMVSNEQPAEESRAKLGRKPMPGVPCSEDPDAIATFYCANCNKSFCEDCVGGEEGARTYCLQCASSMEIQRAEAGRKQVRTFTKHYKWLTYGLAALAILIAGFNGYIIYTGAPVAVENASPPPMSFQLTQLVACRHRLEALATQADYYKANIGGSSFGLDDLESLVQGASDLYCPLTHERYLLENSHEDGIVIRCPTPEAHGLADLFATPGRPAQMLFVK